MEPFTPGRADGRSDREVIYQLVRDADPDTTFPYSTLIDRLQEGLETVWVDRKRVYKAVAAANKTLLKENSRYLSVVTNVGYRVISAAEHLPVAVRRKNRAEAQLKRGHDVLQHTRIDELDELARASHRGQLIILGGLIRATRESARRHDRAEAIIEELTRRVDTIEDKLSSEDEAV